MDVPRLIVRPQGGLANCMRVITSFQTLARCSGRVFELCWAPSNGWSDEDLNLLFENSFPSVPGRPKDNQKDGVIDMFALARTRKILGNYYSTFSRMAAGIGGIGYQRVRED